MSPRVSPQLFDLSTDIAEFVPASVLEEWLQSEQTVLDAKRILKPTLVKGTFVSSDSAGLSKLSQSLELIDVMSKISKPKEIIFKNGVSIGGQPIGIWAADNTEMFYPEHISPDQILNALIASQKEILLNCEVQIGLGVHFGEFYKLGNKLFGFEVETIEEIAENYTSGKEIVVSDKFYDRIKNTDVLSKFSLRKDISKYYIKYYSLTDFTVALYKTANPKLSYKSDLAYPIPFSKEFFDDIKIYSNRPSKEVLRKLNSKYIQNKIVVFVSRERSSHLDSEVSLLEDFTLYGIMSKAAIRTISHYEGKKIKVTSGLGIFTFSSEIEAIDFAKDYQQQLKKNDIKCKVAIDRGDVILFKLQDGTYDITGSPVNIVSKLTEDLGKIGEIYITESIYINLTAHSLKTRQPQIDLSVNSYLPAFRILDI